MEALFSMPIKFEVHSMLDYYHSNASPQHIFFTCRISSLKSLKLRFEQTFLPQS